MKANKRRQSRKSKGIPGIAASLKKSIIVESASDAWRSFIRNIKLSPWIIIADILLIISLGFIVGMFQRELMGSAIQMTAFLSQNQQLLSSADGGLDSFKSLADSPVFSGAYTSLLGSFYNIALFALIAWIIFQGISWCFSYAMSGKAKDAKAFFRLYSKFALYTIAGAALIGLISFGLIKSIFAIIFNLQATVSLTIVQGIAYALMGFVAYLLLVAYSALNHPVRNMIKIAFSKIYIMLPLFVIIIMLIAFANRIVSMTAGIDMRLALALAVLIILPIVILARIYSISFTERMIQRQGK